MGHLYAATSENDDFGALPTLSDANTTGIKRIPVREIGRFEDSEMELPRGSRPPWFDARLVCYMGENVPSIGTHGASAKPQQGRVHEKELPNANEYVDQRDSWISSTSMDELGEMMWIHIERRQNYILLSRLEFSQT